MFSDLINASANHSLQTKLPVVACGAYLKNRACLIDQQGVRWSAMHGDLDNTDACLTLARSVRHWCSQTPMPVCALAHDMHPDFYSSHIATETAVEYGIPAIAVQHHHAHIASVIATRKIEQSVIGVALDGMGLGNDSALWGGELLFVEGGMQAHRWSRVAHLRPIPLPGADKAAREPWRLAAAVLHECERGDQIISRFAPFVGECASNIVRSMLQKRLNCPPSSSAGRWFDAAAGALGVSVHQAHEAEAAMAIEHLAEQYLKQHPTFEWPWQSLDLYPVVEQLFDMDSKARGAAIFHLSMINALTCATLTSAERHDCNDIVLSGGCFANRILVTRLSENLHAAGYQVHLPVDGGYGDDSLAVGQAWVAVCQLLADENSTSAIQEYS